MHKAKPSSGDMTAETRSGRIERSLMEAVKTIQDSTANSARQQHLHLTDFSCLTFLHDVGGAASPKAIIAHLGLTSGAGTALLDRLEKQGYVSRQPNPDDRRGVVITINRQAAKPLVQSHEALRGRVWEAIDRLSPDQVETVSAFLDDVVEIAKQAAEELNQPWSQSDPRPKNKG